MIEFIKKKEGITVCAIALVVTAVFFYKTVLHQQIPFPGDLLINENPYRTESFLGYAPGGYPNLAQGVDVIAQLYPWKYFTIQELKAGRIPFWNPHNFSGNLHMQNYQTGVFYPLNIIFFPLSFTTAWSLFIMSQPFLAILFMYIFLRSLSLGKISSLVGGIAFGFSSYMTVWIEYGNIGSTILWLPLVLFIAQKLVAKPRINYFLLGLFALTNAFLAGYIQGVFYIYLVAIAYTIVLFVQHKESRTKHNIVTVGLFFLLPILFSSIQLLPTYDLFNRSTRSPYSLNQIENLLNPFYYWITIFVPDFFGNPAHRNYFLPITYIERVMYFGIPLIFFIFLSVAKVKQKISRFFLFTGLLFLVLTTNFPLVKYLYLIPIPMISTTVPTRSLSIFIFCMIIVACFGIDYWMKQKKTEKTRVPFIFIGIYGILWISTLLFARFFPGGSTNRSIMLHNLFVPTVIALTTVGVFYLKRLIRISYLILLLLIVFDLFMFFQKITPFAPKQLIYPQTPVISYIQQHAGINRFWGYGSAYILPNFQTYDGTYSPEGNDPLHRKAYGLLLASSADGKYPDLLPRPDANIAPGFGSDQIGNAYRQKILNLLGVKYVLSQGEKFPEETYRLVWQHNQWQIYENKKVLPRFFLSNQYYLEPNDKNALRQIYNQDVSKIIILNQKPLKSLDSQATGNVSLLKYSPDKVTFQTNTSGNMLLFISDEYYPSWYGKVDNTVVPIYKADVAFRAIEVPKGKHTVTFFYSSNYFPIGVDFAAAGIVITVLYSVYLYTYVQKK